MIKNSLFFKKFILLTFIVVVFSLYVFYSMIVKYNYHINSNKEIIIEIPKESNLNDVIDILRNNGKFSNEWSFKFLSRIKKYNNNIKDGIFKLSGEYKNNDLINTLRVRKKETMNLQIPENIRKIEDMTTLLEDSIGFEYNAISNYLDSSNFLSNNNLTIETLPSFFIPNTYEIYKNISVNLFFKRIEKEYDNFWNEERTYKCDSLGLSKIDISILASIVEEEQHKRLEERPIIAGLYLNRLNNPSDFPFLQADPTVKFANNDFSIKQLLNKHLSIDNPYNTYKYKGLPPGPICIPSINAIDAVLNAVKHDYYFMCAGSTGDGLHEFTSTNREHNKNKKKYKEFQNFD